MIKYFDIVIFFLIISVSGFMNYKISKQEKKILLLLNENKKIQSIIELKKINWAYIKRSKNLKLVNKQNNLRLEPINLEDINYFRKN